MSAPHETRSGILAAGNFIVDHVKVIDHWPDQERLASILERHSSNGGGPYNVLKDLAAMQAGFPLCAAGLIGTDPDGNWILEDCRHHGIDTTLLRQTPEGATSSTDVMTVEGTGRRTFFHQRGANDLFNERDIDVEGSPCRILHLAYLMLLASLDALDETGATGTSRLLARARAAGLTTSADVVSTTHENFQAIIRASLPHLDYLFMNEFEAEQATGIHLSATTSKDRMTIEKAALVLKEGGVHRWVIVHTCDVACLCDEQGRFHWQSRVNLPPEVIQGSVGAGDAFAAGMLYAIHESKPPDEALHLATCTAAACLLDPTTSGGLRPVAECLELGHRYGFLMP